MFDREISRLERGKAYKRLATGILTGLAAAAAMILIATNLWVAVLQVEGTSMFPLLHENEIVLAVKNNRSAQGDVIAFNLGSKIYIKRVIASGGDQVDIRQDGTVHINGEALNEPYITESVLGSCDIAFPFQVPSGRVFVLGDNRPAAFDSRDSRFGTVSEDQIVGKVVCRIWPPVQLGGVS